MRIVRILLALIAALLVLAGGAFWYLTKNDPIPEQSDYVLDVDALRALGASVPGAPPQEIGSELVAEAGLPRGVVFAGESLREVQPFVHQVFQVSYPSGAFLLIDAGFPKELLDRMPGPGGTFRADGFQRVVAALPRAQQIVITHEHSDHLEGVSAVSPPEALVGRLKLTREQLANRKALDDAKIPPALRAIPPLVYEKTLAIAPGVVLVKAPGHTPGSQLVYVRTASGRELLFIGDVAWHTDQIAQLHYRPRLVTDLFIGEDRRAVMSEIRTLHDLASSHPEIVVVVSHDPDQRKRLLAAGLLRDGLVL